MSWDVPIHGNGGDSRRQRPAHCLSEFLQTRGNVVIDLTPQRHTNIRDRSRDKRATVTAALPWPIASKLDEAVERLGTNRNRLIAAALEVGIPLVEAQAASTGRQK